MTITYPRDMLCGVLQTDYTIGRSMAVNRLNGGVTQVRELGEPRWFARYVYAPMRRSSFQTVQAWLDSLQGGMQSFYGHDTSRPYPITYRSGVFPGGWNGTASVFEIGVNYIGVGGIPVGLDIKAGDMVGLVQAPMRAAFRVVEDNHGGVYLFVEPRIVPGQFAIGSVSATFVRPASTMVLDPGSISSTYTAGQPSSISFSGVQQVY